jgi:hypothetical protein
MKNTIIHIRHIYLFILTGYLLIQIYGCSSSHGILSFNTLNYPASMSGCLYNQDKNTMIKGRDLEVIQTFKYKKTFWSLAYGIIPLSAENNICESLNAIVKQNNGDGIINLTITIEQGVVNKISAFFMYIPSLIPIIPGAADITISGEIVKLKQRDSSQILDNDLKNFITPQKNITLYINKTQ